MDLLSMLPLRHETIESVRARLDADVNIGLTTGDPSWIDTTEGSFFWDVTQPVALEMERLWDAISVEYPAVAFVQLAYGEYLDEHGVYLDTPRLDAVAATGAVTFTGTNGTFVAVGTEVGVPTVADEEPVVFVTTESGTISGGTVTLDVKAADAGLRGNISAGGVDLVLSPIVGVTAVTNAAPTSGGADVENDEVYRERLMIKFAGQMGAGNAVSHELWARGYPGVGFASVFAADPAPGYLRVVVTDTTGAPVSQGVLDGLQAIVDPWSYSSTTTAQVALPATTIPVVSTTGADVSGTVLLAGQVITYTGVTATSFTGASGGSGTIPSGTVVSQSGHGTGLAPVGQRVLYQTPVIVNVTITATVTHREGYTLDGTAGTVATRAAIEAALADYIDGLGPGDDVVLNRVEAAFFEVEGVYDVGSVLINSTASTLAIGPLQLPDLQTVTLT